jgi:hypothetical protein
MKKAITVFLIALLGFSFNANAQYEKGQKDLNIGVGLLSTFGVGKAQLPPVSAALDFGITDNISLGGYIGYSMFKEEFAALNYTWKYSYLIIGARGAYHFDLLDNMDTYAGLLLAYNLAKVELDGSSNLPEPSAGGIAYSAFLGARYHFNDSFGIFGELGYGISVLNIGLTVKF